MADRGAYMVVVVETKDLLLLTTLSLTRVMETCSYLG